MTVWMNAAPGGNEYAGSMLRWWLNLKWASAVHADAMAKVRLALLLGIATAAAVMVLR